MDEKPEEEEEAGGLCKNLETLKINPGDSEEEVKRKYGEKRSLLCCNLTELIGLVETIGFNCKYLNNSLMANKRNCHDLFEAPFENKKS